MLIEPGSVLISPRVAGFLLLACKQMQLRERAEALPRPVRAELVAVLDELQTSARQYRPPVAPIREDETPLDESEAVSGCTTRSAATRLGLSERRVQQFAASGILPARRVGRSWVIDTEAVALMAAERRSAA